MKPFSEAEFAAESARRLANEFLLVLILAQLKLLPQFLKRLHRLHIEPACKLNNSPRLVILTTYIDGLNIT